MSLKMWKTPWENPSQKRLHPIINTQFHKLLHDFRKMNMWHIIVVSLLVSPLTHNGSWKMLKRYILRFWNVLKPPSRTCCHHQEWAFKWTTTWHLQLSGWHPSTGLQRCHETLTIWNAHPSNLRRLEIQPIKMGSWTKLTGVKEQEQHRQEEALGEKDRSNHVQVQPMIRS